MIIYQVLARLWRNGKFSDWDKDSFDYLHSLNVDCIWYTGIPRHASGLPFVKGDPGSPYSIEDPKDVNPYLADDPGSRMLEFEELVHRTHDAGLKLIIDFVPNHMAMNYVGKVKLLDHCDYDWTDTLKIDYSASETWEEMLDVVRFWAAKGVDGIRCDMVELVPADFFKFLIAGIRKDYPLFLFVAEVYNRDNYGRYINDAGFDLLYDKSGLYDILHSISSSYGDVRDITCNWQHLGPLQEHMLNFLENHDEMRQAIRGYAPLAVSSLFNNASFMIYFGQEIGESAVDSENSRTSIFNWAEKINPLSSLSTEQKRILGRFRELMACVRDFEGSANYDLGYCNSFTCTGIFAFLRILEDRTALIVCNFTESRRYEQVYIPKETGLTPGFQYVEVEPLDYQLRILKKS